MKLAQNNMNFLYKLKMTVKSFTDPPTTTFYWSKIGVNNFQESLNGGYLDNT